MAKPWVMMLALGVALILATVVLAAADTSWWVIAGGGGTSSSDGTSLSGSIGQWMAADSSGDSLQLGPGFWHGWADRGTPTPATHNLFLPALLRSR